MKNQAYVDFMEKHRGNINLCFYFFLIYVLIYGYMSLRLGVGVEETQFDRGLTAITICNGRWGIYIFRFLTSADGFLPYTAGVLSGIFISYAVFLQTNILKIHGTTNKLMYAALYLGCIQWVYQLRYSNQSHAVALGMLSATAAVYIVLNYKGWKSVLLGGLLMGYAIATYQTIAMYALTLIFATLLRMYYRDGERRISLNRVMMFVVFVLGVVFYYVIGKVIFSLVDISDREIELVQSYQSGMVGWASMWNADFQTIAHNLFITFIWLPAKDILGRSYECQWIITSSFLPALWLIYMSYAKGKIKDALVTGALLIAILYVPFSLDGIMQSCSAIRTELASPLCAASIWGIAFLSGENEFIHKCFYRLLLGFSCFVVVVASCRVSEIARDEHWSYQRGKEEMLLMYLSGLQVSKETGISSNRIVLLGYPRNVGGHLHDVKKSGFMPNETWPDLTRGGAWTNLYADYFRMTSIRSGDDEDIEKHKDVLLLMPNWPMPGSVRAHKGEIIIRIGDLPD